MRVLDERLCPFSAESIGKDIRIGATVRTEIDLLGQDGRVSPGAVRAINNWLEESYKAGLRDAKNEIRERLGL